VTSKCASFTSFNRETFILGKEPGKEHKEPPSIYLGGIIAHNSLFVTAICHILPLLVGFERG